MTDTAIIVVTCGATVVGLVWALAWMVVRATGENRRGRP